MNRDAGALADVLIIAALVGVLEPAPTADIIGQDAFELSLTRLHLRDHAAEAVPSLDAQAALAFVGEDPGDFHSAPRGVFLDAIELILCGILLVLR